VITAFLRKWFLPAVIVLSLLSSGCPEDYMPGGKLDQAMDKDIRARLQDQVKRCKPGTHPKRVAGCPENEECFECVKDR